MTIERLNGVLSDMGAPATTREVAEMLWLACHITPQEAHGGSRPSLEPRIAADTASAAGTDALEDRPGSAGRRGAGRDSSRTGQTPDEGEARTGLFPRAVGGSALDAGSVLVPAAPMISNPLLIERALRPLKRRVPSEHARELDEDATAALIADQPRRARQWIPIMRQAPERWLSLAFVLDTGPSMQVWQPMAEELRDIFARLGAFHDLRTWYLRGADIAATPDGLPQNPAALLRPPRRQVVLVLSDCSGPHWWDGRAQRALHLWGTHAATAVLQTLSERLWRRTAIPPIPGAASLKAAGAPNGELVFSPYEGLAAAGTPIPVMEISADWLADWAHLLLGPGSSPVPAAISYVSPSVLTPSDPLQREQQLPIAKRVRRFQDSASPEAVWLAACLAVSVPSLPILRLIQHQMLGGRPRRPAHLAEVLLSGLLRPDDERRQTFEFVPGAREALIESMPRSQSWYVADVLSRISAEIEARAGRAAGSFQAFHRVPDGTGEKSLRGDQPFALVSQEAIQYLRRSIPAAPLPRARRPDGEQHGGPEIVPATPGSAGSTGHPSPSAGDIYLSYVPEDRMWADWIAAVLAPRGIRIVRSANAPAPERGIREDAERSAAEADRTIAILSAAYMQSPQAKGVADAVTTDPAGTSRRLIPILVRETRLEQPFSERAIIDLTRGDAGQATDQLLNALGNPPRLADGPAAVEPRYPRTIPRLWRVPTRNASFTGRNDVLEHLHDQLIGSGQAAVLPVALHGPGGVGKTQIAQEYAHRFMSEYDLVWWVPSEQSELINPTLADLADHLGIRPGGSPDETADRVGQALRRGRPYDRWLLIFDNAEEPDEVGDFFPGGPGHVIVTSRNPAWSQLAEPVEIDVFSRRESVDYLQRRVRSLSEEDASLVASELGDLPLAIEQAGAWLAETGMLAADYVARIQEQFAAAMELNQPANYPASAATTYRLSFDRLRSQSPAAARLLELCACFGSDPISLTLLNSDEMIKSLTPYDKRLRAARTVLGLLITEITRFSLAKVDREMTSNSIQLHRLVAAAIRNQMEPDYREAAMHEVHMVLAGARPRQGDTDDPRNWARYDLIWPHLGPSEVWNCDHEEARQLLIDRVRYLWKRGDYDDALEVAHELEQQWQERLGPDDEQVLFLRFHIANVLRSQGRFADAYPLDTEVLRKQEVALGDDHPYTLRTAGGLGGDLRGLGRFGAALELDEATYRRNVEILGPDDPNTLSSANNLAVDLRLVGDCFRARDLDRETRNYRQVVLGPDHPYTLHSASMLAHDMREAGDYPGSADLLAETYERYQEVLGEDFVDTLRTGKSLAVSLRKAGRFDEAYALTTEIASRNERMYAASAPDSLACRLNLACDLSALDDTSAAIEAARGVLQDYGTVLGAAHPFTLAAESNLSTYLRGAGSAREALELADGTLAGMRDQLGDDHPFTLSCQINKANCLHDLGRLSEAESPQRDTLERLKMTLGPDHPDTLVCQANLSIVLRAQGRTEEAEVLQLQVIARLGNVIGHDHPRVIALREWRLQSVDLEVQPT